MNVTSPRCNPSLQHWRQAEQASLTSLLTSSGKTMNFHSSRTRYQFFMQLKQTQKKSWTRCCKCTGRRQNNVLSWRWTCKTSKQCSAKKRCGYLTELNSWKVLLHNGSFFSLPSLKLNSKFNTTRLYRVREARQRHLHMQADLETVYQCSGQGPRIAL